ncbi:hypothetical protein HOY80DRAFT_1033975 [Tuber brumale]|nr:hypothetical protein HOY80DRAFT_1033975 [Tuber brumale]
MSPGIELESFSDDIPDFRTPGIDPPQPPRYKPLPPISRLAHEPLSDQLTTWGHLSEILVKAHGWFMRRLCIDHGPACLAKGTAEHIPVLAEQLAEAAGSVGGQSTQVAEVGTERIRDLKPENQIEVKSSRLMEDMDYLIVKLDLGGELSQVRDIDEKEDC